MAQVMISQKKDNSALYQQGASAAGSAIGGPLGGMAGGLVGQKLASGGGAGQIQGVAAPQVNVPQVGAVPETQAPEQMEAPVNQNDALQRRLAMLNKISAQSQMG